jgi:hypothetical protein
MNEEAKPREKPPKPIFWPRFFTRRGKPFLSAERIAHFVELMGCDVVSMEEDEEKITMTITIPKTLP